MPPRPRLDSLESPILFVAIILANTSVPQVKLNGEASSTATGIVHVLVETTAGLEPLQ